MGSFLAKGSDGRAAGELASEVRLWRGRLSAARAAPLLGIPVRTWQNIESGRGFAYPTLLRIAMRAVEPPGDA